MDYCAPEQVAGNATPRSDLYSVACTMFELVTGHVFDPDPSTTNPNNWRHRLTQVDQFPRPWQPICRKALQLDENLRHRSASEFKSDLQLVAQGLQPTATGPTVAPPQPPQPAAPTHHGTPHAAAPAAQPTPAQQVSIRWTTTASAMINPGEYRQVIAGQVIQNNLGLPAATVIPFITDIGGGGTGTGAAGTSATTGPHGDFSLSVPDVTVPVDVDERRIQVVVEDPNTGAELFRGNVSITRPFGATAVKIRGAVGKALASPFRAIKRARQNRQLGRAMVIQANAQAKAAKIQAKAQLVGIQAQAKQAAQQARIQSAQQQAAQAQAQANQPQEQFFTGWQIAGLIICAVAAVAFFFALAKGIPKIWTIVPVGILWGLVLALIPMPKKGVGFIRRFACLISFLWAGLWATFWFFI